jgi:hypothetical protein
MIRHEHAQPVLNVLTWPSWRYGPEGQSAIFQCAEDVPEGWTRKPDEQPEPFVPRRRPVVLNRDELIAELQAHGVEPDLSWGMAHMKKVLDDLSSAR